MWSLTASPSEGTLPLTPPLPAVVSLLSHLTQVEQSVTSLSAACVVTQSDPINLDNVSSGNKQMAYSCHELAALALRVISGSPSSLSTQGYVVEVQQLSHEIARAGKTVNHITKKGLDNIGRLRRKEITKTQKSKPVENIIENKEKPVMEVIRNESHTSMATGQLTQWSPEHHRVDGPLPIKQTTADMYNSVVDDDDDSTLI